MENTFFYPAGGWNVLWAGPHPFFVFFKDDLERYEVMQHCRDEIGSQISKEGLAGVQDFGEFISSSRMVAER